MLNAFWDSESVILSDFLEKRTIIYTEQYIDILSALKKRIRRLEYKLKHFNVTVPGITQVQS